MTQIETVLGPVGLDELGPFDPRSKIIEYAIDDIARHMDCATSTASEHIKRLQNKGLLARFRPDDDERVVRVRLTDEGRAALVEHTSLDPGKLGESLSGMPVRDQRDLIRLLESMTRRLTET